MGEMRERELGVPAGDAPSRSPAARGAGETARRSGGFLDILFGPRLRPALALAAVVIVAGAVWLSTANRRGGEEPVMRGDVTAGELRATAVAVEPGTARLEWTPSAIADGYALVFLAPDLTEIARVPVSEARFELKAAMLPGGLTSGTSVLWRVVALHGGDEIARSRTATLVVP
jgi:hypothetical protein